MPALILFRRRWSLGSDDLVFPAAILLVIHLVWLIVLSLVMILVDKIDWRAPCMNQLREHTIGYLVILSGCILLEGMIIRISSQGSITNVAARKGIDVLLYLRIVLMMVEFIWLIFGVMWLSENYSRCSKHSTTAKDAILVITISNWFVLIAVVLTIICSFDWTSTGRSIASKRRRSSSNFDRRESLGRRGSRSDFESRWGHRCFILSCCLNSRDRHHGSLVQVVNMLSEMFDGSSEDVVATDIIAGLILLRRLQTLRRDIIISQESNDIYQFLSGIAITPSTKFLDTNDPLEVDEIKDLIHFMQYSMASYGWPVAVMASSHPSSPAHHTNQSSCCCLCPLFSCSMCKCQKAKCCPTHLSSGNRRDSSEAQLQDSFSSSRNNQQTHQSNIHQKKKWKSSATTVGDNCCKCNQRAFDRLSSYIDCELIHAKYSARVGEPSFSVIVDHDKKCVVVCIRGTFSLEDLITDLNAVPEVLPLNPLQSSWTGHRGMVFAAEYVKQELYSRDLLKRAFHLRMERGTPSYQLVLVGHSLGAGVACILAVLLREKYPTLHCFAFSPPGGLFSPPVVEFSRKFITSVVLGKDVVPRLGLHSVQVLVRDLVSAISFSDRPKWKIIGYSCCFSRLSSSSFLTSLNKRSSKKNKESKKIKGTDPPPASANNNNTSSNTNNDFLPETRDPQDIEGLRVQNLDQEPKIDSTKQRQGQDLESQTTKRRNETQGRRTSDSEDAVDAEIREAIQFWSQREKRRNEVSHSLRQPPTTSTQSSWRIQEDEVDVSSQLLASSSRQVARVQQPTPQSQDDEGGFSCDPTINVVGRVNQDILLPPGNIIHIVRSHPQGNGNKQSSHSHSSPSKKDVIYQALRVNNGCFDEVLISPVMIHDHLPFNVLSALEGLLTRSAPPKPDRLPSFVEPSPYDRTAGHFIYQSSSTTASQNHSSSNHHLKNRPPPSGPLPLPPSSIPLSIPDSIVKVISDQPQAQQHVYASIGTASSSNNINNMTRQHEHPSENSLKHRTPTPTDTLIDALSVSSKLLIETSFTDLRPSSTSTEKATYYGSKSNPGSYGRASLMNGYNNYYSNGSTAGRSNILYNSRPSFLSALRHHRKHDLFRHDWIRAAPLASPENSCLTDASSLIVRNLKDEEEKRREAINAREEQSPKSFDQEERKRRLEQENRRRKSEDICGQSRFVTNAGGDERGGSRLSLQELIDVFSDCSDSRSLQDMVEEAKRVLTPINSTSPV